MRSIILSTSLAAGLLIAGSAFAQAPTANTNPGAQPPGQTGAAATTDQAAKDKDKDKDKRAGTGQNASTMPAKPAGAAGSSSTGANAGATGAGSSTDSGTAQTGGGAAPAGSATTGR